MTLLLALTLAYAAILVLVLAVGLLLAWIRLRGIHRNLEAAHDSLVRVQRASADLGDRLAPFRDRLAEAFEAFGSAAEDLAEAEEQIHPRRGRATIGAAK